MLSSLRNHRLEAYATCEDLTIFRPNRPCTVSVVLHVMLIFSIAWPGVRAVTHAHDDFVGGRDAAGRLAEHVSKYHADGFGVGVGVSDCSGSDCQQSDFFQWHVHWTLAGPPGSATDEPGRYPEIVSSHHWPTGPPSLDGFSPVVSDLLTPEPRGARPLPSLFFAFSRGSQNGGVADRVRFCVWTC